MEDDMIITLEGDIYERRADLELARNKYDKEFRFIKQQRKKMATEIMLDTRVMSDNERELEKMQKYYDTLYTIFKSQQSNLNDLEKANTSLNNDFLKESKEKETDINKKTVEMELLETELDIAQKQLFNEKSAIKLTTTFHEKTVKALHREQKKRIKDECEFLKRSFDQMQFNMQLDNQTLHQLMIYERDETRKLQGELNEVEESCTKLIKHNESMKEDMRRWEAEKLES